MYDDTSHTEGEQQRSADLTGHANGVEEPLLASETASVGRTFRRSAQLWKELRETPERFRVLTGERPTGPLHLGHYFGTLKSRVTLQGWGVEIFLVIADYQAITDRTASSALKENVLEILLDYLAVGIDPSRTTVFCHSMVPSLNQLLLPFLSIVTMAELRRNPTVKEEIQLAGMKSVNGLMMTYPVHQAADILFCKGNLVPGGQDQLPHVEITRRVAQRINRLYFGGQSYFPEPELLVSEAPLLLGVDGRKMGKSLKNAIYIRMSEDETAALIRGAKTDAERRITYEPERRPEVSNLVRLYALCTGQTPEAITDAIGDRGAAELKRQVTEAVNEYFRPIRRRRSEFVADQGYVWNVLRAGNERANAIADATLEDLRVAMAMDYY